MKILSWNIQSCRGADGRVDPPRIVQEIARVANADVICLQEVSRHFIGLAGSIGDDQFTQLAQGFPEYARIEGIAVDVLGENRVRRQFGNLLLSRLPVRQVWRHLLPWPADSEHSDMPRVAIEAVIESPDVGRLRVTTTHLAYYSPAQRLAQIEALRTLHATASGHARAPAKMDASGGPFHWLGKPCAGVVTGDFNCEPGTDSYLRMLQPIDESTPVFRDAWHVIRGAEPHTHTVGLYDTAQWPRSFCCDFIFVSDDLARRLTSIEVDLVSEASDHQPLLLTMA